MKIPKRVRRYCPFCGKHTEHKVDTASKGKRSPFKKGERYRRWKIEHGYRGFPYSIQKSSGRYKVKLTKKLDIRFKCLSCGKMTCWRRGLRLKKFEFKG